MPYRAGRYPHSAKGAMPLVPAGCLLMDHGRGCLGQALIIMTLALAVCFGGGRAEAATVACTAGINSNAGLNVVFNQGTGTCTTVSHASITQAVNGFVLGMNNSQWNVIIDKHNVFTGAIPSGHNYDCGANPATDCTVPVSLIDDNGNTITFTAVWTPGGGSMNLAAFNVSYTPLAPTITALSTNSGPTTGGQSVTLTGTYFDGTTSVTFGGTSASITSISSDGKTIAVTTPAHVSGPVDVAVTNGAGLGAQTVTSASAYTYVKANQSAVNVSASTNPFLLTSTTTLTGSGGNGSGAFSYSVAAAGTAGCSIAPGSNVVSASAVGSCTVTATRAGDATYNPATSAPLTLAINQQLTSTVLAISQSSVLIGQPITAIARVTTVLPPPQPVTSGSVTFTNGSTVLCNSVALNASGQASCTTSFTASGTMNITANYSGSGSMASSASASVTPVVVNQKTQTTQAIASFLRERNNRLLGNNPDASRQIDRMNESAGGGGTSVGLNSDAGGTSMAQRATVATSLGNAVDRGESGRPGVGALVGGRDREVSSTISEFAARNATRDGDPFPDFGLSKKRDFEIANDPAERFGGAPLALGGPGQLSASFLNGSNIQFSTSVRDLNRFVDDQRYKAESSLALIRGGAAPNTVRANPWDMWVEGKLTDYRDKTGYGVDGRFGMITVGTDYVFSPKFLAGVLVQLDQTKQTSATQRTSVEGSGWMAGPYGTLRLSEHVFWQARAAWGTSSNEVSPFMSYTDKFRSSRWLASTALVGRWNSGQWSFRPSASVSYLQDVAHSYTDTFGLVIPDVKSALGQAKIGPEIAYKWQVSPDLIVQPKAGAQLIWNFAGSSTVNGVSVDGIGYGPAGARGWAELGIGLIHASGVMVDISGSYDGIGSSNYNAVTGKAMVRMPLN